MDMSSYLDVRSQLLDWQTARLVLGARFLQRKWRISNERTHSPASFIAHSVLLLHKTNMDIILLFGTASVIGYLMSTAYDPQSLIKRMGQVVFIIYAAIVWEEFPHYILQSSVWTCRGSSPACVSVSRCCKAARSRTEQDPCSLNERETKKDLITAAVITIIHNNLLTLFPPSSHLSSWRECQVFEYTEYGYE